MGLILDRSSGSENIPPGERVAFEITSAEEDFGMHGPQVKLRLEAVEGEHEGKFLFEWCSLAQPRLDFVKALRNKNYDDETITNILRERGFEFDDMDEPEEAVGMSSGGKLFNICMAAFNGDANFIDQLETIPNLIDALEGRKFISITKPRGNDGKYTGITWDQVYTYH